MCRWMCVRERERKGEKERESVKRNRRVAAGKPVGVSLAAYFHTWILVWNYSAMSVCDTKCLHVPESVCHGEYQG